MKLRSILWLSGLFEICLPASFSLFLSTFSLPTVVDSIKSRRSIIVITLARVSRRGSLPSPGSLRPGCRSICSLPRLVAPRRFSRGKEPSAWNVTHTPPDRSIFAYNTVGISDEFPMFVGIK